MRLLGTPFLAREDVMRKIWLPVAAAVLLAPGLAQAQELRVGFINTASGAGAGPGVEQTNAWKIGLEHEGWTKDGDKLGGVVTKIFYADDQQKPESDLPAGHGAEEHHERGRAGHDAAGHAESHERSQGDGPLRQMVVMPVSVVVAGVVVGLPESVRVPMSRPSAAGEPPVEEVPSERHDQEAGRGAEPGVELLRDDGPRRIQRDAAEEVDPRRARGGHHET